MTIPPFKLEEYLSIYEFKAPYLLCCSDAQSFGMHEILELATQEEQQLWNDLSLGYTEPSGHPLLKEKIAKTLYHPLSANDILCFAGAEEAIFATLQTVCTKNDHVIVLTPCYQSLLEIPAAMGTQITTVDLTPQNQWRIDLTAIENAIQTNTKCLVMNFPHNPTGQIIQKDELETLIKLLSKQGIWLFSDEVYGLLGPSGTSCAAPAAVLYDRAISLGVMSKAFGMAGLRIGWIACQDQELLQKVGAFKHYLSICNSAPAELLSLIALSNIKGILSRNNEIIEKNLAHLDVFFEKYAKTFSWVRPQGGCVGFVNHKNTDNIDDFCKKLVEKTGVLLLPASVYDYNQPYFRIGFGRKNMPDALQRLESFLNC